MPGTYRSPGTISLVAALGQVLRDLERACDRIAQLEQKNTLLQGNLDAAVASSDEKMLRISTLEEKVVRLQLSSQETDQLKEDRVVREALEREMQRLYKQSTDLEDSHKEELYGVKAVHVKEMEEVADRHKQELKQMEDYHTEKLKQAENRLQLMESSLRTNRSTLNSKETTLRVTSARLKAIQEEMETNNEDFEIEGAALRAQVQTLQRQLGRSLREVEELRAKVVQWKKHYKDDFDLWLDSMNEVLAAASTYPATHEPPRPATA